MKLLNFLWITTIGLACCANVNAQTYSTTINSGTPGGDSIPDNDKNGFIYLINASGITNNSVTNVSVHLTMAEGFNGDIYAYLLHIDSSNTTQMATLLNRVGKATTNVFGYHNAGFNVTLTNDITAPDIHWYGGSSAPTGVYYPDGRRVDPATVNESSPVTSSLANFNTQDPNGVWVLFLADMSAGGVSKIQSFTLNIGSTFIQHDAIVSGLVQLDGFVGELRPVTFIASSVVEGVTNYLLTNIVSGVTFTNDSSDYGGALDGLGNVIGVSLTVPPETTHISAKTDWTMSSKVEVSISGGVGTMDFTDNSGNGLIPGDLDGDNLVTISDYLTLSGNFGLTDEDAGGDFTDLTGAGQTDINTFLLWSGAFGRAGSDY